MNQNRAQRPCSATSQLEICEVLILATPLGRSPALLGTVAIVRESNPCFRREREDNQAITVHCPSLTRGRSRMRESRTYGSVRGAGSNLRPYRDGHPAPAP